MNVYGQTHIGLVRENNQDALEYGTLSNTAQYAVVCDGMGGANGGNIASKIAVEVIGSRIRDGYRENQNPGSVEHLLTSAMATANVGVYDRAQRDAELSGMGTTVVAVITCEHTAYISHVGDSRLYLYRNGNLSQVTRDHSVVQDLIESGQITEEEARSHPRKNYITRALGVVSEEYGEFDELEPDEGEYKWGTTITTSYFPLDNSAFFNDCDLNLLEWLAQYTADNAEEGTESFKRSFLGRMLFSGDDVFKPVKVLSGGEKVRCMLSRMMLFGSNVLVLDQPTNHLDLESITAVNNGLIDYKGVVLFSSHDHEFIQTVANRIMDFRDGKLIDKLGTYEDYIIWQRETNSF